MAQRTRVEGPKGQGQKRPKVPIFGQYLIARRENSRRKRPSVETIARDLDKQLGITVDDATLRGYEYGWVDKPDPVVLLGLARLYKTDIHKLITVLAENRRRPDLSDIELEQILRRVDETSRVETSAAARLAEVQKRLLDIGAELVAIAEEGDGPREQTPDAGAAASSSD